MKESHEFKVGQHVYLTPTLDNPCRSLPVVGKIAGTVKSAEPRLLYEVQVAGKNFPYLRWKEELYVEAHSVCKQLRESAENELSTLIQYLRSIDEFSVSNGEQAVHDLKEGDAVYVYRVHENTLKALDMKATITRVLSDCCDVSYSDKHIETVENSYIYFSPYPVLDRIRERIVAEMSCQCAAMELVEHVEEKLRVAGGGE